MLKTMSANLAAATPEGLAFQQYADLTARKRDLKRALDEVQEQLSAMESQLFAYLGENGFELVRVAGFTISTQRNPNVFPSAGHTREEVCEALKASGLHRFVKEQYQVQSLSKYVRELEQHSQLLLEGDPNAHVEILPPALAAVLEIRPSFSLRVLDRRHAA